MVAPVFPRTKQEKAKTYLLVMEEVKSRLQVIDLTLSSTIHPILIREVCYLELRHICELVAIGCLIAQGDFKTYKAFRKAYNPTQIFKYLAKINPQFFPQSVTRTQDGKITNLAFDSKPNAVTRKELEKLWKVSGDYMHRLTASKFFKPKEPETGIIEKLRETTQKVLDLLDHHGVSIPDPDVMLLVSLSQPDCRVIAHFVSLKGGNTLEFEEFKLK